MWLELFLGSLFIVILLWLCLKSPARTLELAAKIPGPKGVPIFGNIFMRPFFGPGASDVLCELMKIHGPVMRLWMGNHLVVVITSPEDCEAVFNNTKLLNKTLFYKFYENWLGTGLLTSDGVKWRKRRKALTPAFNLKILQQFVDIFNENNDILVDCLKKRANQTQLVDLQPYIIKYTLDVLCETVMGTKINAQIDPTSKYLDAFHNIVYMTSSRVNKPWLYNDIIWKLSGNLFLENKELKVLGNLSAEIISNKQKILEKEIKKDSEKLNESEENDLNLGNKKKTVFLELLLRKKLEGSEIIVTDNDIKEEVNTFMFGGHDTSKTAICFALYCLAKYPDIQNKVYKELIDILGQEKRNPAFEDLQNMKYLEQVIKEVLRLYPPVTLIGRTVTEEITLPSGYTIPVGSLISIFIYGCHRNEKYFPNPLVFNPDNFTPEASLSRHAYAYLPFSGGSRNCIGQRFAMLELKAVLCKVLINYSLDLPANWNLELDSQVVLQSVNGFKLKLKER